MTRMNFHSAITSRDGEKGQPPSTIPGARYWKWPYWDKESLYLITKQKLGDHELLNIRLYHDRYDNEVNSYTDGTYTTLKPSGSGSVSTGRSIYNDRSNGGSISLESFRFDQHALRLTVHYKNDEHKEKDGNDQLNSHFEDTLMSYALEDTIELNAKHSLALGIAQHEMRPDQVFSRGNAYSIPSTKTATDLQAEWRIRASDSLSLYASIADKSRLPTLKDRYSQRMSSYIENPHLQPEAALNYEIGMISTPAQGSRYEAAMFRSDITDKIQTVVDVVGTLDQMQNIGEVRIQGAELSITHDLTAWLTLGGNYTAMDADNMSNPATRVTDIPKHKVILHASVRPIPAVEISTLAEHNSRRWVSNTVRLGDATTFNLKAAWTPVKSLSVETGINNVADRNNELADGFPSAGRMWFANLNYTF
jgi:iron complex outermembrane receptor protein